MWSLHLFRSFSNPIRCGRSSDDLQMICRQHTCLSVSRSDGLSHTWLFLRNAGSENRSVNISLWAEVNNCLLTAESWRLVRLPTNIDTVWACLMELTHTHSHTHTQLFWSSRSHLMAFISRWSSASCHEVVRWIHFSLHFRTSCYCLRLVRLHK